MSSTSDEFLRCLNLAREYPAYFLSLLEKQLGSFVNDRQMPLAQGVLYETNQGKSAWVQARNFILSQKPLPPFSKHSGLVKSATDHRNDICQNGIFGHRGSDGSSFSQRILRHCKKGPGAMAEIIGADFDLNDRNPAEMTILSLIIDDGVKDRGHRKTIFSPTYRYVGWSTGKQEQKNITVFNLTENNLETYFGGNNNENSFCGVTNSGKSPSTRNSFNNSKPNNVGNSWERGGQIVKDITNNSYNSRTEKSNGFSSSYGSGSGTGSDFSKLGTRKGKRVAQKVQNTKTYYEDNAKIIETTTKLIYNDGSVQENTDRRTIYTD